MRKALILGIVPAFMAAPAMVEAQAPTPVNLYVADLKYDGTSVQVLNPRKLTGDRGVSSQPAFTLDGKSILFVSRRDTTGQSDIYRIELATGKEAQITRTAENENTPTATADGGIMVIRWTPATLFKEWGPWIYDKSGVPQRGVLPGPDTVGYYVPIDSTTYAMMRPKSRPAVAVFDARKGTMTDFDWPVANLPPQRIPARNAVSYTRTDSLGHNEIRQLDLGTLQTSAVGPTVPGRTVHAWTPNGFILMGKGNSIFTTRPGQGNRWRKVAEFRQPELQGLTTYIVSPTGDKVILISPVKPPLHQALRDSLQAGRSIGDAIGAYRKASSAKRAQFDLSEGGLIALAGELVQRGKMQDGVRLLEFSSELFPKSYSVQMEIGAARKKWGDLKGSLSAYQRSLALNPRVTADDKSAADAAEKAIADASRH